MQGTIEWAKTKLDQWPKAKRELGPLLDALGGKFTSLFDFDTWFHCNYLVAPLTQIVSGVGLLLAGVLNLVSRILGGLGLGGLLKGILAATVRSFISLP